MANVLNRRTLEYRRSVNDPEYSVVDWIFNPDMSLVDGFPVKHWKIVGETVVPMSEVERNAVNIAEIAANTLADRTEQKARMDTERALKALALVVKDEVNILRALAGLGDRTNLQVVNAVKAKMDTI